MLFQCFGQRTYLLSRYVVINEDYGFLFHTLACLYRKEYTAYTIDRNMILNETEIYILCCYSSIKVDNGKKFLYLFWL